jgi:hypothetical protein
MAEASDRMDTVSRRLSHSSAETRTPDGFPLRVISTASPRSATPRSSSRKVVFASVAVTVVIWSLY